MYYIVGFTPNYAIDTRNASVVHEGAITLVWQRIMKAVAANEKDICRIANSNFHVSGSPGGYVMIPQGDYARFDIYFKDLVIARNFARSIYNVSYGNPTIKYCEEIDSSVESEE